MVLLVTRPAFVVIALIAGVVWLVTREPHPEPDWCGGVIVRGSITKTENGHVFAIHPTWGFEGRRDGRQVIVGFDGVMPDTVCDGSEVGLEGWMTAGFFHAVRVHGGGGASKYDGCRRWRCRPERERPPECRPKFE